MFFDLHTDILFHIVEQRLAGKKNIIKDYHLKELLEGKFTGGIWTYYTDTDHFLCEFDRAIDYILEELEGARDVIQLVTSNGDFRDDKLNVVLGFESIQPIKDLATFDQMYQLGFRHAMLTWNEENHYATGVKGTLERGLTDLGREVIRYMTDHHMIIDVSHANQKTFYDILETTNQPILASHSNAYSLKDHPRNLTDDQIKRIIESDGLIGLTAVPSFLTYEEANLNHYLQHFNYLKEQGFIDHLGVGFDFMHYINGRNLPDLRDPYDTPKLIAKFKENNYSDEEIESIASQHAIDFVKRILG